MATTVSGGSTYEISAGQTDTGDVVLNGGELILDGGGTAIGTADSGVEEAMGTDIDTEISDTGVEYLWEFGIASGTSIDGGHQFVVEGGTAFDASVSDDGQQCVYASGTPPGVAIGTTAYAFGIQEVFAGGTASSTLVDNGGYQNVYSSGMAIATVVNAGGVQYVWAPGSLAISNTINDNADQEVYSSGTVTDTTVSGAEQDVYYGGTASNTIVDSGGSSYVYDSGVAVSTTVSDGGYLDIYDSGVGSDTTISSGGTEVVSAGGTQFGLQIIGGDSDDPSTVIVDGGGSSAELIVDGDLAVPQSGTALLNISAGGTADIDGTLSIGGSDNSGSGSVTVTGSDTVLSAGEVVVGGLVPGPENPNDGQSGIWTYSGGTGTLDVSDDATVTVDGGLTLQDDVEIGPNGTETAEGGIDIVSGGSIDVGGGGVAPPNTLSIADNASLVGHGLISSTVTGQTPVSDSTTTPTYSLTINNSGKIEAEDGTLALDGNLTGDGQVLIGQDSTLVIAGSVADDVTAMFLPGGDATITIDDPNDFQGLISSENFEPGDSIDLPNVPYVNPGAGNLNPDGASFYFETGEQQQNYVLQIVENEQTYDIPISDDEQVTGGFTLSDDGHGGTLITHTAGPAADYSVTATADGRESKAYGGVVQILGVPTNGQGLNGGIQATGFAVGPHLILTAEHAVSNKNNAIYVNLPADHGVRTYLGYVIREGFFVAPIKALSAEDWAYIYVPGATFTDSQIFHFDTSPSPDILDDLVNVTGYPAQVIKNGKETVVNGLSEFQQYNTLTPITQNDPYYDFTPQFGPPAGESGGPVWYDSGNTSHVIGIDLTDVFALNVDNILDPSFVHTPAAVYTDPPSNDARITSAVILQSGDVDTGQTVQFVLNMSENVVVTGSGPTLSLNDGGVATYNAVNSTGTELEFDYTAGAGDKASNLEITQVNSIQTVQTPGGASINFAVLDNLPTDLSINSPLVVTSVTSSQIGEVAAGQIVHLTLTLNSALTVNTAGGAPTLTLNDGATAIYDAGLSHLSAGSLVFDYTVGSGDETANLEVASVNLPTGTTIQNAGGYNADFSAAINAPTGLQVGPAYISAITPSLSGDVTTGQTLQLTLMMSQAVTVDTGGGSPALSLSDGAVATYDAAASNPSAGSLVFAYTVRSGDYTSDLQVLGYDPNGATVTDAHGVNADFSSATQYDLALDVNAAIVTNLTVSPMSGEADSGQQVTLTLTLSKPVTVSTSGGSPTLSLNDEGTATYDSAASNPSAGTLVFAYAVGATDETPSLQVSQVNLNGATIDDVNGNAADLSAAANFTTTLQVGPAFVSLLTPSLTGEIFTGQTDLLTLAMSQGVTVNTASGLPTLSLSDGATATYSAAASDPSAGTLVFGYTVGASDYAIGLTVLGYNPNGAKVTDANGINADFSSVVQYDLGLDVDAATVTDVTSSPSSGEADSRAQVTVTLTMSEAVAVSTTNGSPTLSLSTGATATYNSVASSPSAGTLVFDYTVGATDETANLSITQVNLNDATIKDTNGNAADLSAASSFDTGLQIGPVFVDSLSASASGEITTGQSVQFTLAMSSGLTVTTTNGAPTLSLSDGAVATYDAAASDPSTGSLVFDYTVGSHDYATDLTAVALNPNSSIITDANGVTPDFSGVSQFDSGLDVNAAYVTDVTAASPSTGVAYTEQQVLLTLTMSELVTANTTGGSPTLDLSDGAIATYDSAASNPAAGSLVFTYNVGITDEDPDLQIAQVNLNGAAINDAHGNAADLSAAANFNTNLQIVSIPLPPPPSPPPSGTTAIMIMNNPSNGDYEIYNIGGNQILAAYLLGQVGAPWTFVGMGTFQAGDVSDMLLRNGTTGAFEAYYISNNVISNAADVGAVGTNWNFAGTGDFDGQSSLSELLLRNADSGSFELYQVAGGGVLSGSSVAAVGNNFSVKGFGFFSETGTTQMMMQGNSGASLGQLELYTYQPSTASFAGIDVGDIGSNLTFLGCADLLGNGTTQMVMQQNNGDLWLYTYDPGDKALSGREVGAVGSNFQVVGFGPLAASGQDEMLMQDAAGAFEVYQYNAGENAFVGTPMGAVGAPWMVDGIAGADPSASGSAIGTSTAQLVQAMAAMSGGTGASTSTNLPVPTPTTVQTLLTRPQHA